MRRRLIKLTPKTLFTHIHFRRGSWGKAFHHHKLKHDTPYNITSKPQSPPKKGGMRLSAQQKGHYGSAARHPPFARTSTERRTANSRGPIQRLTMNKRPIGNTTLKDAVAAEQKPPSRGNQRNLRPYAPQCGDKPG